MSASFLVDTNILIYSLDEGEPDKRRRAQEVIRRLTVEGAGAVSAQVLSEFASVAPRKLWPPLASDAVLRFVQDLARDWVVYDLTRATVLEALRGAREHQLAHWDALIWATAKLNSVPYILSEDFSDGQLVENVRVLNPLRAGFVLPGSD